MFRVPLLALLTLSMGMPTPSRAADWSQAFQNPPPETQPWVYWYWISDNISKDGITRDLEAMAEQGIAEAVIGNVDATPDSRGKVTALSPEWWGMVEHAVREGQRLGVRVGMFNGPGWSQSGGPWIKPEQSMRYLVTMETPVEGPTRFDRKLPAPEGSFQQVAVLAYPVSKEDANFLTTKNAKITSEATDVANAFDGDAKTVFSPPGGAGQIDLEVEKPFTARSLVLYPAETSFRVQGDLQAREPNGDYRTIRSFEVDRRNAAPNVGPMRYGPVAVQVPETSATHFRLIFRNPEGHPGFTGIELTEAVRLERYVEKQLGKLFQEPLPLWDAYVWPRQSEATGDGLVIDPAGVRDLTSLVSDDGTLRCNVPDGDWIIARIGMVPTGVTNVPASPEARGLEVDKMNWKAVEGHFDAYFGKLLSRVKDIDPSKMGHMVSDSYETGSQNWTDGGRELFIERNGYDPLPWMPVLSGRVVGSADQSERFLWDLRRLVADRISTEYVGGFREKANKNGIALWLENYGHWGFPGEFLSYGANSNRLSGEFWTLGTLGSIELRAAASAAHTTGKRFVSAEAFTSAHPTWTHEPWNIKRRSDWSATEGVNHFVLHVYIHQPYEDRNPGVNAWFGTEFNRKNTWFPMLHGWVDSFQRKHAVLQQGLPVADVLYFIGEDAPKMTGTREPALPAGYDYDYINADVIQSDLVVKDGRFVLPDGMSYKVLVLPPLETMRPKLLAKIADLVEQGGTVFGPRPVRSPSMQDFPKADEEVRKITDALWQDVDGKSKTRAEFGKGLVVQGEDLAALLPSLGVPPDVRELPPEILWTHRADAGTDAYFLTNQSDRRIEFTPTFRVGDRQPEWWDYVSGEQRELPYFEQTEAQSTSVPMKLEPGEAGFVVFRKPAQSRSGNGENFPHPKLLKPIEGPWKAVFDKLPAVTMDPLIDWTTSENDAIRHYSGRAKYTKTFKVDALPADGEVLLNLGRVEGVAEVRMNGKELGVLWANPRRVRITDALVRGTNTLEIDVANTWRNRLIGDNALPVEKRSTWVATETAKAGNALIPSGLLGPVTLEVQPRP